MTMVDEDKQYDEWWLVSNYGVTKRVFADNGNIEYYNASGKRMAYYNKEFGLLMMEA